MTTGDDSVVEEDTSAEGVVLLITADEALTATQLAKGS